MKTKIYVLNSKLFAVVLVVLTLLAGFSSCDDDDDDDMENQPVAYSASFVKSSETVVTSATGTTTASFNPVTLELSYTVTWTGLGSNAVNMHFHNDGPVMAPITGFAEATGGTVSGKVTLTAQQATDLAAGKIYTQIHTENYPGGEVIATLSKSTGGNNPNPSGGDGY